MIINLRETNAHRGHRARTINAAVSKIIDTSLIGEPVSVEKMISGFGDTVANNSIRMLIARQCREQGIGYQTRTGENGEFVFVRLS